MGRRLVIGHAALLQTLLVSDVVVAIDAVTVQLPLPFTLEIAGARIDWRRYAIVEVRTEGGYTGCVKDPENSGGSAVPPVWWSRVS